MKAALRAVRTCRKHFSVLAISIGAAIIVFLSGCANCDYAYNSHTVKYSNDADHRVIEETVTTLNKKDFSQGWSNGSGKTVDIHPEASIIGAP